MFELEPLPRGEPIGGISDVQVRSITDAHVLAREMNIVPDGTSPLLPHGRDEVRRRVSCTPTAGLSRRLSTVGSQLIPQLRD
jgi:hypothetical protein